MSHYRGNVRDLEFNLFEVVGLDAVLGLRRPFRQHRTPGSGPPRRCRSRDQGAGAVLRAEVPLRRRDR
ncbi:acyl-CoA dehydrogenase N-terminal domain-containing protein [Nocardia sp. NPDC051787]|uniref:acyl-CoA dehydrogenase N-terminal domain-containing protein n=1 Tax=Nocardia sp. NPDC051787 TaxID=3155415 RepID=UPI00342C7539